MKILDSIECRRRFRLPAVERRLGSGSGDGRGAGVRVERRQASGPRLVGYAAVFEQLSQDLGGFREKIARGAFAKSLRGDVRGLLNHNSDFVLARTTNRTLRLSEDRVGLAFEMEPLESVIGEHVLAAVERRDISEMSFAFRTIADRWIIENGETTRTLLEVELFDVSPVAFAAYPQTDVAIDDDTRAMRRRFEELLVTLSRERKLHLAEVELDHSSDLARAQARDPWRRQAALERELGIR